MIAFLRGTVMEKDPDRLIVLVGGFGLEVRAPAGTIDRARQGEEVELHTCLQLSQDALRLYGFDSPRSRDLFGKLQSVSGFGAQKAISVLSIFPPDRFAEVVRMGDAAALTIIPGVGKKGAERLLLEMKDKFEPMDAETAGVPEEGAFAFREAAEALVQLGYTRLEAHDALKRFSFDGAEPTVEELLQFALKQMR